MSPSGALARAASKGGAAKETVDRQRQLTTLRRPHACWRGSSGAIVAAPGTPTCRTYSTFLWAICEQAHLRSSFASWLRPSLPVHRLTIPGYATTVSAPTLKPGASAPLGP
jgi:hypothetical protein